MARLGWILFFIMTAVSGVLTYKFILAGDIEVAPDGRTTILLDDSEQTFFLNEMRSFLIAIQQITEGIKNDNMDQIATAARKVGMVGFSQVPASLIGKMPLAVKKLGRSTHNAFDQMAMDAESLGDKDHSLSQLNQILSNCTACHALYKIR